MLVAGLQDPIAHGISSDSGAPVDHARPPSSGRSRTWAWCSAVSTIARSAWRSARSDAVRRLRQRLAHGRHQEPVGLLVERERGRLARAAHDPAGRGREALQVLGLATARARPELRQDPRGEQQLHPEREAVGGDRRRAGVDDSSASWLDSSVNTSGCGEVVSNSRATASQARAAASSVSASVAQRRVRGDGVDAGDRVQVAAAVVEHRAHVEERLEPRPEAAARAGGRPWRSRRSARGAGVYRCRIRSASP